MRLALLMTNTDESAFAQAHPKDGAKWRSLIGKVRPEWRVEVFAVKDTVFPDSLDGFDGVLIGGSPASVHDGDAWIDRLLALIRDIVSREIPLFGACFGHQAIAMALGASVERNSGGYVLGSVPVEVTEALPWIAHAQGTIRLHAAHNEQVASLPKGARCIASTGDCPIAGFAIGDRLFTTQYHPEITARFMTALLAELEGKAPVEALAQGRTSMALPAENTVFAEWIARFFEQARA